MRLRTIIIGILLPNFLIACSSKSTTSEFANKKHLLNNVTMDTTGYFEEYALSASNPNNTAMALKYLEKGVALSRSVCFEHLDYLAASENDTSFGQNELGILVILATGIMGLNGVDQDNFSKLALGAAAVNSSIDLYRNHYLLGPDSDVIVDLIKNAMNTAESEISNRAPTNFVDAYTLLESYSRLCSDSQIRRLVRDAIKSTKFEANESFANRENREEANKTMTEIAVILDRSGLSNKQYFGLYWKVKESPTKSEYLHVVNNALGDAQEMVDSLRIDALVEIKKLYSKNPYVSAEYQLIVDKTKSAIQKIEDNPLNESTFKAVLNDYISNEAFVELRQTLGDFDNQETVMKAALKNISDVTLTRASAIDASYSPSFGSTITVNVKQDVQTVK